MAPGDESDFRAFARELLLRFERVTQGLDTRLAQNTEVSRRQTAVLAELVEEVRFQREVMRTEMRAQREEMRAEMHAQRQALFRILDRLPPPEPNGA